MAAPEALGVCLLCFASDGNIECREIDDNYRKIVENALGVQMVQSTDIAQKICSYCETHIESTRILQERAKFTQSFWRRYSNHLIGIQDPIDDENVDPDMQISCHDCGALLEYHRLLEHITSQHGNDHVPGCQLCSVLFRTDTIQGDQIEIVIFRPEEEEIIKEELVIESGAENEEIIEGESLNENDDDDNEDVDEMDAESADDEYKPEDADSGEESNSDESESVDSDSETDAGKAKSKAQTGKGKPFQCEFCPKTYVLARSFMFHLETVHNQKVKAPKSHLKDQRASMHRLTCKWCSEVFWRQSKLEKHWLEHDALPHNCDHCDDKYANRTELNKHIRERHPEHIAPTLHYTHLVDKPFKCKYCSCSYMRREQMRLHMKTAHKEVWQALGEESIGTCGHVCEICGNTYSRIQKLDKHMLTHMDNPFQCKFCEEKFNERKLWIAHMTLFHPNEERGQPEKVEEPPASEGGYVCAVCGQAFTRARNLHFHMEKHEGILFPCDICKKDYVGRAALSKHMRNIHKKRFKCVVCEKRVSSQVKLDEHMKTHMGFPCEECKETFATRRLLHLHSIVHNPNAVLRKPSKPATFKCTLCSVALRSARALEKHMREGHKEEGYPCATCGKVFLSKAKLKTHTYSHNRTLCGICGLQVSNSFTTHMRRHAGVKPFKCKEEGCGMAFPRNCDLKAHQKTHTGEKNYECEICGMRFSRPYKISVHMRVHTGEKPYKCHLCGHTFAQSFDLTLHVRRHTGEKPYECKGCGERFILNSLLNKHSPSCPGRRTLEVIEEGNPESFVINILKQE